MTTRRDAGRRSSDKSNAWGGSAFDLGKDRPDDWVALRGDMTVQDPPVTGRCLRDGFQAKRVIDEWIAFCIAGRAHSALDQQTPVDAYPVATKMDQSA